MLIEVPFVGGTDVLVACAEHIEAAGLVPLIAHPERTEAALDDPHLVDALADRGWLLQVNATSLLGRHGHEAERIGWGMLASGAASLVASDGHRETRPPQLDAAYALAVEHLGPERARPLFDGSALGLAEVAAARRSDAA